MKIPVRKYLKNHQNQSIGVCMTVWKNIDFESAEEERWLKLLTLLMMIKINNSNKNIITGKEVIFQFRIG